MTVRPSGTADTTVAAGAVEASLDVGRTAVELLARVTVRLTDRVGLVGLAAVPSAVATADFGAGAGWEATVCSAARALCFEA